MDDYDSLLAQVRSKPETAKPVDDYDALLTQVRQDRQPQVQSALTLSSFKKPDQEAERANLVRDLKTHLGEDWSPVAIEPEEARRRLKVAENDHVLQNSPRLAQKYLDTGFADRTFDDVKPLSEIEKAVGKIGSAAGDAGLYVAGSTGSAMSRLASGFYGYLAEMPADLISSYVTKPILGDADPFRAVADWGARQRKSLDARANLVADISGGGADAGYLARMGYGALESVFQNLVTLPFAVESAAGKAVTTGKGAIASAMEAAQAIDLKSLLPMMISTAGQSYGKASDQGMDPAKAALFATLQGGSEGLTERIGLGQLVRDVKMTAPLWKVLRNQLVTENITEQAATHWQDFNEWAMLPENKDKTFGEYIADRPSAALDTLIQTTIATVLQTSVMRASMRSMRNQMGETQIGQLQEQNLKDIIAAVSSSQTTQRTPQDVIELIESVDGENATEVHINANIASEVLNQSQLATITTPEALQEAAMHGGDIVVPISQFAVAVAQDPSMQSIVEHARTDPDMPSGAEARAWESTNGEAFRKELEAVTARHEANSEWQQSAKEVEDFVFNQLKSAGRHTESVNRSDALMHKAFASVMAERTGMLPMDFFKKHILRVQGGGSEAGQSFNQVTIDSATTRGKPKGTISFGGITGPSGATLDSYTWQWKPFEYVDSRGEDRIARISDWELSETSAETGRDVVHQFIVTTPEGKQQVVSAETALKILGYAKGDGAKGFKAVVSASQTMARLHMQLSELLVARESFESDKSEVLSLSLPDVVQVESDKWSMGGEFVMQRRNLFPNAKDGELLPERRIVLENAWRDSQMRSRGWTGMNQVFAAKIEDIQKRIKRAQSKLDAANPKKGDQFDQSGKLVTDTPAFRNWFGESKVVDAEGKPLVVYHGTSADFTEFDTRSELGAHLGTKDQAQGFADRSGGRIMPIYASIKNPIRLVDYGGFSADYVTPQLEDLGIITSQEGERLRNLYPEEALEDIRFFIERAGYDGVVYLNRREGLPKHYFGNKGTENYSTESWRDLTDELSDEEFVLDYAPEAKDSYIAFRPEQIKSATGNRGTFDPNDPNILHQQSVDDFLAMFDEAATIELTDAKMSKEQIDEAERQFLSAFPEGTRYGRDTRLLKRVRRESDAALESLRGDPEVSREVASRLGPFSSFQSVAEILPPDSFNPNGSLRIAIFGKEQTDAGLVDEPALTITVTANGELTINGPEPGTDTFAEFKARGWADHAKGANGEVQQGWTALTNPENPGQPLPIKQLLPLLADTHARVREWRGDEYVGLHWTRATGALGGLFSQDESAVFFQSAKDTPTNRRLPTAMEGGDPWNYGYDYEALPNDVRQVVDDIISTLPEPEIAKQKLIELKGTPWAKQAIAGAVLRDSMLRVMRGEEPRVPSYLDGKSLGSLKAELKGGGVEAVFAYLERNSIIGNATKPESAVASSYLNCQPSRGCATYCYAAGGERYHSSLAKAELTTIAIEMDPARAAAMTAAEWENRPNAMMGGALRMFDRGDGDARWLPYLDALAEKGIRTHIFSKRADFLAQVNPLHLRLLSLDNENQHLIDNIPDGVSAAYVYSGTEDEVAFIEKNAEKIQLILPVKLDTGFVPNDRIDALPDSVRKRKVCPVDRGVVTIASGYTVRLADGTSKEFDPNKVRSVRGESALVTARKEALKFQNANPGSKMHSTGGYALVDADGNYIGHFTENGLNKAEKMAAKIGGKVEEVNGWNCVNCDRAAGIGCYAGNTTDKARQQQVINISGITGRKLEREAERTIAELESRTGIRLPADQRERLLAELVSGLREAQGRNVQGAAGQGVAGPAGQADAAARSGAETSGVSQRGSLKQGERGSFNPDTNTIALLQNADLSTFLHESGHYFLEVMASVASQPDAPASVRQDFETLLQWFNVPATPEMSAFDTWSMMSLEEKRQYHEQFARGFEAYLMEGKAPSIELQGIFSRFRRWLLDIYRSLSSLDVQLTDEVRGVMDRMLATDEQIADAEAARRFAPIFQTQEDSGMDDAEWAAYQSSQADATDAAVADLQARSIRDMRWLSNAKSKKMAELQKASKALRDLVTMDVRREVMQQPIYMVWNFLSGKPEKAKPQPKKSADLDPTTDSLFVAIAKLGGIDRLEIMQTWGTDPEDIKKLPRPVFGKPIVRTNDGKSIDELAQRLADYGYLPTDENGKADVRDLEDLFAAEMRGDEQYSNQKDYAAAMQEREPGVFDLENFPHGKLDTDAVRAFYGNDSSVPAILEGLKMLGQEGYLPDEVAAEFGFSSGDDMMRQLAVAQSPKELIAQMVDQRMLSDHAELSSDAAIEQAAEAAIHNDARSRFLMRELNALRKAVGKTSVILKAARSFAEQKIASLKVRDAVKSSQHTAAEVRSARESEKALASGDTEAAATHKRDQILNHELARASLSAKAEIAQIQRFLKRFDNATTRKAISYEYRDQIDALLEKFDLRQSVSDKELERRRSLQDWIASQEAMGLDPAIDERLTRDFGKKHIRDLTLDELRGLKDSIANIEHLGRLKNQLLTAAKNRNLQAVSAEIAASLNKYGKGRGLKDADIGDAHGWAALKQFGEGFAAEHRKLASIARQMDGDKDGGPMWEYFIRSMNAAGDKEATMRADMSAKLAKLFEQIKGVKLGRKEQVMPGVSMTRENMLVMALNWGNAGNRQRLMAGGLNNTVKTLTENQVNSILSRLSKQEWDFVQGVWDLLEANRPAIAEQEKRLAGVEPKWVDPVPVTTPHGTYRGGYFPAKYDGNFSSRSNELEAITDLRQQMQGAAGRAQTRKGYTQERAAEVTGRPLKLGFSALTQHVNEVTHRLAWQDWLIDTNRLLKRDEIEQAIRDHYGPVMLKQIKDAVKDIAAGDIGASSMMERGLNHMRTGATIAGLGWNLTTSFLQPLGLTQSMVRIGWVPVARGMKAFIAHPWKTIEMVESRSEFMKHRAATMNREINDVLNTVRNDKISKLEASFFYTIQMMQKVADMPTWLGEYEKQIAAGNDEARAIALADQAVIDAQGAGQMKDLSAVQRGNGVGGAFKKLFTNFYSYFNVTYNLAVERGRATDFKDPLAVGKLAVDYLMLFTVPAILGALMKELLRGSEDDWDEEKILKKLAKEQLNYLMGTMVLTREIGAAVTGDYGYSGPAGVRLFGEIYKLKQQVEQGEIDKSFVKAAVNVAGIVGLPVIGQFPAGQVNRTLDGIVAVSEGTAGPQAVVFGAPLKH